MKIESRFCYLSWLLDNEDYDIENYLDLRTERDTLLVRLALLDLEAKKYGWSTISVYKEVRKLNNAYYARLKRLRQRVLSMLCTGDKLPVYFVTLTFNDECLDRTIYTTRRRYVKEFCNANGLEYIANVDYGKLNGREHYHCLIKANYIDHNLWDRFGFSHIQKVQNDLDDIQRTSKYVAKLSNHAVKETCKQCKLIYSRSKKNEKENV